MASDATSTIREAASSVSEMAEDAYKQGSRYVREASDYLPEVDGYAEVVRRPIEQSPLIATVAAGAIGYLAAYLIHGGGLGSQHRARPDYDREYGRSRYDREYGQGQRNSRD